jgi:hypothetical protein
MYILKITTVEFVLIRKEYVTQVRNRYYKGKKKWKLDTLGWLIKFVGESTHFSYITYSITQQ